MRMEFLSEAMCEVRSEYVAQAAVYEKKRRRIPWGVLAACLCLAAVLTLIVKNGGLSARNTANTSVAYGFVLDGRLYFPISFDERKEFGLVPEDAAGLTEEYRSEPTEEDLGALMGYAQESGDPDLVGAAVYHWAALPDNQRICIVDAGQGYYAYFVAAWHTDAADGADMDAILASYGVSAETVEAVSITDRLDRPVTDLTEPSDIQALLDLLPGLTNMGAAAHEARFEALWQETYHDDRVWLDENGTMHYEGLDQNDWTVYNQAHELWNSGQRQLLFHLTNGEQLWMLYNPAIKSLSVFNSYFALGEGACSLLNDRLSTGA